MIGVKIAAAGALCVAALFIQAPLAQAETTEVASGSSSSIGCFLGWFSALSGQPNSCWGVNPPISEEGNQATELAIP
ncbi:hypothetical protein GCM10023318_01880 [Nocardia callitridis]|uniref:Uncharacterized protein n=1 Tax=Nocardia callitridis TaxID=648753 RepID=A0ABP9JR16_9NOCA